LLEQDEPLTRVVRFCAGRADDDEPVDLLERACVGPCEHREIRRLPAPSAAEFNRDVDVASNLLEGEVVLLREHAHHPLEQLLALGPAPLFAGQQIDNDVLVWRRLLSRSRLVLHLIGVQLQASPTAR
jgi:hypothetical protein